MGSKIGAAIGLICLLGTAIGCSAITCQEFVSLKDDIWLRWFGVLALNPHESYFWQGMRTASKYCVTYNTQQGQGHERCTNLYIHLFEPNTDHPPVVYYNAKSPDHASTSYGLQVLVLIPRIILFLLMFVFSLLLGLGSIVGAFMTFAS